MSTTATLSPQIQTSNGVASKRTPRHRTRRFLWTVDNYHRAIDAGLFDENRRVELINGEIISKMSQNPPHVRSLARASSAIVRVLVLVDCYLRAQAPVTLRPKSEPEPDICIAKGNGDEYANRHPSPDEILLLVEVSDTTLRYDQTEKSRIYARAGIAEYWILNLNARTLEVYRNPQNGAYPTPTIYDETMSLLPLAAPPSASPITVADLLP